MGGVKVFICIALLAQSVVCGPLLQADDYDRDTNFLINKIQDSLTKVGDEQPPAELDKSKSSEVVHFDSKGESIEGEKAKLPVGVACKAPGKDLPTEAVSAEETIPKREEEEPMPAHDHHLHVSSSIEEHAIRFDHHGNTKEEYKDTEEEHHDNHVEEAPKRKKKKKKKQEKPVLSPSDEADRRANINNRLNEEVVHKQLQIRDLADEDSDENDEEDDIPLITIPMVDILKQYQRMAQGFESSTEEYSDEMTTKRNHFDDPHLQDALRQISAERKKVKQEKKEGKKVKPAARRVFEDLSKSEEEL